MKQLIDIKELVGLVERAAGDFSGASDTFADLAGLFEAIRAATPAESLAHRLARLGEETADRMSCCYDEQKIEYNAHAARFRESVRQQQEVSHG